MICKKCGSDKEQRGFPIALRKGSKVYYRKICIPCYSTQKNERRQRISAWLKSVKSQLFCIKCYESDIACLDFHHREPDEKDFAIGHLISKGWSIKRIQKELDKCDVLCSNCHRKHHYYFGSAA